MYLTKLIELIWGKIFPIFWSKALDFLICLIFSHCFEDFELFKIFRFLFEKRYPSHPCIIINEQHEIVFPLHTFSPCWSTNISVNYFHKMWGHIFFCIETHFSLIPMLSMFTNRVKRIYNFRQLSYNLLLTYSDKIVKI